MLFVSERSWKHHFVTLLLPYTFLVWDLYFPGLKLRTRLAIGGSLLLSFLFMATTSTEFGGLFADGRGHEIAQGYGMFLWAAVLLYAAVAWRLRARGFEPAVVLKSPGPEFTPHFSLSEGKTRRYSLKLNAVLGKRTGPRAHKRPM